MCYANNDKDRSERGLKAGKRDLDATDVPLGDGLAGSARLSILNRREQLRRAVEEAS